MAFTSEISAEEIRRLDDGEDTGERRKILLTASMGFFTDAYDLFIIGLVVTILEKQWGLTGTNKLFAGSVALLSAAPGAWLFGRLADRLGRKSVYGWEMLVLAVGAIASAFSPNVYWLIGFRAVLGFGIGGDYPVSSTIMSEYAGRAHRGRLVALVFSAQGLGLIVGPLLAVILLGAGVAPDPAWRIMLACGAIPALSVFYLRRQIAETPRFRLAMAQQAEAEQEEGGRDARPWPSVLFTDRRLRRWLFAISATWFLFDFAYYGDTIGSSQIVKDVVAGASTLQTSAIELGIFAVFSLPAFYLAAFNIDRIGRRPLQILGFIGISAGFVALWAIPGASAATVPFVILFGATYFFSQFGPNTTTFVFPSEIFPVGVRTTGNGIAAGIAKIGAFAGAWLLPDLLDSAGLSDMILVPAAVAVLGAMLTLLLPEPKGQSLEAISDDPLLGGASPSAPLGLRAQPGRA